MNRDISKIRKDFTKEKLDENLLDSHPINQFNIWLNEAIESEELEPTAMTLSTVSSKGIPSGRIVLLKKIDIANGFYFFTNYESKKGQHLQHNNLAALTFFWPALERQIRIEGSVKKIDQIESDIYFNSRPPESQISAIISPQSKVIENREELESWYNQVKEKKEKQNRPNNWGGYSLTPFEMEFWQGRSGRLHDRIRYKLKDAKWHKERLAP